MFRFLNIFYQKVLADQSEMLFTPPDRLPDGDNFLRVVFNIVEFFLAMSWFVSVVVIIIAGLKYIVGGEGKQEEAKKTIQFAIVGLVVIIVSYTLVNWLVGANSPVFNPTNQSLS